MEHTDERPELRLQCDRNLADQLQAALKGMSESRCRGSERKNIHGDASTCVLIATLAIKELPILLSKLRDLADSIGRAYAPLGIKTSSFFQRMRESHKTQLRFPVALHFTVTVTYVV